MNKDLLRTLSLCPAACRAIYDAFWRSALSKWCCCPPPAGTHRINHPSPLRCRRRNDPPDTSPNANRRKRSRSPDGTRMRCARVVVGTIGPLSPLRIAAGNGKWKIGGCGSVKRGGANTLKSVCKFMQMSYVRKLLPTSEIRRQLGKRKKLGRNSTNANCRV